MSALVPVYFDNNATTAVDEAVLAAMLPYFRERYGNPASLHGFGEDAADAVAAARGAVARLAGAGPKEVVFTSGGTESNNAAIHAALTLGAARGADTVLTSAVEHPAVGEPLAQRARRAGQDGGCRVETIGVDASGRLDRERLLARLAELGPRCALVTTMWANNETGVLQTDEELTELARACSEQGVPLHVDAVQVPGKLALRSAELGIDLLSLSAHKFHGPKGVGALIARGAVGESVAGNALVAGGSQERDRRGGTLNVPGIVGLGRAAELALEHVSDPARPRALEALRDSFEQGLCGAVPNAVVHGLGAPRLPNTASVGFPGLDGETLQALLAEAGLAVSTGAACSSGRQQPSHVLLAMGVAEPLARATLRFSLARHSTPEEVSWALEQVVEAVGVLAALAGPAET